MFCLHVHAFVRFMCLIVFAWQVKPNSPLIAASNRDEFYARPALPAHRWEDYPQIFAGRDLEGGGTWIGIAHDKDKKGWRFAALTNVRAPHLMKDNAPTRGLLVSNYLASEMTPEEYIRKIRHESYHYNGFNLLVADKDTLIWYSNMGYMNPRNGYPLKPGIYGLSNALLDDPWPKVVRTRAQFAQLLGTHAPEEAYFDMLSDTTKAPDSMLPKTGVSYEWEKLLSSVFIESPTYGTRASTLVEMYNNEPPVLHERVIR